MPAIKDSQLQKELKGGMLRPLYLLYGAESHLLRMTVQTIIKACVDPSFAQFNLQEFEGDSVTLNDLQTACEALPMMAPQKCVTVKNWAFDKLGKGDLELLQALLQDPNPSTVLVLYYTDMEFGRNKNAKTKKICALVEQNGVVCEFAVKDRATLKRAIAAHCRKAGAEIDPAICDQLIEYGQGQYSVILGELEKLLHYVGEGGRITQAEMDALGIVSIQNTAFDLSNAILAGQYSKAFGVLDRLFTLRVEPVMILGALSMSFIDLYRVKAGSAAGISLDQIAKDFQYRSKYRIQKLTRDLGRFSLRQIHACIDSLEKADRMLKTSRTEGRLVLEQMIGEMMTAG